MAHYNLYDSLSLDPSADSSQLVADIDAKLAQLSPENTAARDELTTAREIFSVGHRRTKYDKELANPTGPEVDIARIRDIAALPAASATDSSSPAAKHAAPSSEATGTYTPAPGYTAAHTRQPQQGWPAHTASQQAASNNTGFSSSKKQFTVDFSNMAFPVTPARQRCQSIMWCVIWGILLLMWLIAGIRGLSLANTAGDTTAMSLLFDSSNLEARTADFAASIIKTLIATPLLLVLGEFIWSIRKTMGLKAANDA